MKIILWRLTNRFQHSKISIWINRPWNILKIKSLDNKNNRKTILKAIKTSKSIEHKMVKIPTVEECCIFTIKAKKIKLIITFKDLPRLIIHPQSSQLQLKIFLGALQNPFWLKKDIKNQFSMIQSHFFKTSPLRRINRLFQAKISRIILTH